MGDIWSDPKVQAALDRGIDQIANGETVPMSRIYDLRESPDRGPVTRVQENSWTHGPDVKWTDVVTSDLVSDPQPEGGDALPRDDEWDAYVQTVIDDDYVDGVLNGHGPRRLGHCDQCGYHGTRGVHVCADGASRPTIDDDDGEQT